jgi:hypothetical protein
MPVLFSLKTKVFDPSGQTKGQTFVAEQQKIPSGQEGKKIKK